MIPGAEDSIAPWVRRMLGLVLVVAGTMTAWALWIGRTDTSWAARPLTHVFFVLVAGGIATLALVQGTRMAVRPLRSDVELPRSLLAVAAVLFPAIGISYAHRGFTEHDFRVFQAGLAIALGGGLAAFRLFRRRGQATRRSAGA